MPAKNQYLSPTKQRALKIIAGISYLLAMSFQLAISAWLTNKAPMITTSVYASIFLWVGLMIVAFLAKNGWRIWGIYLGMTALILQNRQA
ncbi:MAG: hypothetical protein AAGJ18_23690 [Bacteroidota bacterium]